MSSNAVTAQEYWGYLIKSDKSPTPLFEQLLLGVANYINQHVAPWDTQCLTPAKLAAFYRLVGGDYDPLFLDTSHASLSFIYQSLGCFHTLQPERDPYTAPKLPALTLQGFVRWQTIQLLLEPEEHVPFLQAAVKRFELINPIDGNPFPSVLPKEALPCEADPDILEWHEGVSQRLAIEAQSAAARSLPPRPQMALSDVDVTSSRDSSIDSRSIDGAAACFTGLHHSQKPVHFVNSRDPANPHSHEAPWSPEQRRSSLPEIRTYSASWPSDGQAPASFQSAPPRNLRPHIHERTPSDISTISTSTSSSSSITTSSVASTSPVRHHRHHHHHHAYLHPPTSPPSGRRQSLNLHPQRPASQPQVFSPHQIQQQPLSSGPPKTKSVKWQDMNDVFDAPRFSPRHASAEPQSRGGDYCERDGRYGDYSRWSNQDQWLQEQRGRGRLARSVGPSTGVGGRRYPPEPVPLGR